MSDMANLKRFCFICCCFVISTYLSECSGQLESVNGSTDDLEILLRPTPVNRLSALTLCTDSSYHHYHSNLCKLKPPSRRVSTKTVDGKQRRKSGFINTCGFIQSLMVLICFAVCVVLSGVISLMFVLVQVHFSLTALFLLPSWVIAVVLLVAPSFPNLAKVTSLLWTNYKVSFRQRQQCGLQVAPCNLIQQCGIINLNFTSNHVQTVITMLLQRSGDVELNPGPLRDGSTSSEEHEQPSASVTVQESPQLVEGYPRVGTTQEEKPTQFDQLQRIPETFTDIGPHDDYFESDDDSNQDSVNESPPLSLEDDPSLLQHTAPMPAASENSHQPTLPDTSNSRFYAPSFPPLNTAHRSKSMSQVLLRHPTTPRIIIEGEKRSVKEAYDTWNNKSDLDKGNSCIVFDEVMIKLFLNLLRFYRDINRLNTSEEQAVVMNVCPQCFEMKDKSEMRQSHIIPKNLLKTFQLIHVPVQQYANAQKDTRFLVNFWKWSRFPPDRATATLLCDRCETASSVDENGLKGVYLYMTSNPNELMCHIEGMKYRNFHHILAQILFRGLLVNVDIDSYDQGTHWFMHEDFKAKFIMLWNYSRNVNFQNPPDVRLFLLPNKAYDAETTFSIFSMERVLRSPHYTELILCDIAGLYLYFKIDCFHIVLPVDEKSECYFNTFRNGLCTDDATEKIYLLQCTRPKQHRYQSCKQNFHADDDELTVHFPDVLMQWNVQFHNDYICEMLNQPSGHKIKDYDIPFILFPGEDHRHNDLDLNVRTNKAAKLASKAKATIDLSDAKKFHLNKLDHKKATEDAANTSPLKVVMVSKAEYKQVLELKVKLGKMKLESEEQQEKISILLSQIDNAIAENQRLRDAYIKLSRDVRRNSETNGQDRRLSLQLAKECLSSYEKTYETLSRRYSAESVRYKGGATHKELREEISANIKRSERLKESTKDMEEVHDDCSRIHEKFKGLLYSRTLSSST